MNIHQFRRNLVKAAILGFVLILFGGLGHSQEAKGFRAVRADRGAVDPCVSPDGKTIAAAILGKIWLIPFTGGEARQVSEGLGWDGYPAWSPDGRFLAFSRILPDASLIVEINLGTGGTHVLHRSDGQIRMIRYHPRDGAVYFVVQRNQYSAHIWRLPLGGGEAKPITFTEKYHNWHFSFSPDGKEALVDSGKYGASNLYRLDLSTGNAARLTRTNDHQINPEWNRDGKSWIYLERKEGMERVMVQKDGPAAPVCVFESPYDDKQISLSPDGGSAVLSAGRRLFRLDLESGECRPIPFIAVFRQWAPEKADLVVVNARLYAGDGRGVLENATIEVKNGRIASIRTGEKASGIPASIAVLDAKGKMVLPGLMDSHYHLWEPVAEGVNLLRQGVTTIREVGSALSPTKNFQEAIEAGLLEGPRVFVTGPLIDGPNGYHPLVDVPLSRPESAAALVRSLKAQGVDAIKVYFMLEPDVLAAVVREAGVLGLPVVGHIGVRTGWMKAMEDGINGLCHIRLWPDLIPVEKQPQGEDGNLGTDRDFFSRVQADWTEIDPDGEAVGRVIQSMVEKNVGFDPTLGVQKVDEGMRGMYNLEQYAKALDGYKRMCRFVYRCWKSGVFMLVGTDNAPIADEMEAFAEAGIPNEEIIKAATVNGARWLGRQDDFGTIEPGKRADLIVVDGDPVKDIRDIRKIETVVKDGRIVFDKTPVAEPKEPVTAPVDVSQVEDSKISSFAGWIDGNGRDFYKYAFKRVSRDSGEINEFMASGKAEF